MFTVIMFWNDQKTIACPTKNQSDPDEKDIQLNQYWNRVLPSSIKFAGKVSNHFSYALATNYVLDKFFMGQD